MLAVPRLHGPPGRRTDGGFSLIEVLVTLIIVSFGLLGLGTLQLKIRSAGMESFQRTQALVVLEDMQGRINANRVNALSYATSAIGTGDDNPEDCSAIADLAPRDLCEWSNLLKGASVVKGGTKVGAMIDGRGCVDVVNPGVTPVTLRITVAWQGVNPTIAPSLACGANQYGNDNMRRVASVLVTIGELD